MELMIAYRRKDDQNRRQRGMRRLGILPAAPSCFQGKSSAVPQTAAMASRAKGSDTAAKNRKNTAEGSAKSGIVQNSTSVARQRARALNHRLPQSAYPTKWKAIAQMIINPIP
jgi:hypothetical protein